MFYRVFDEEGNYLDYEGVTQNLVSCVSYNIPEGSPLTEGWVEFPDDLSAMKYFGLTEIVELEEIEILL